MKHCLYCLLTVCVTLLSPQTWAAELEDGVAAVVNNSVVLKSEVDDRVRLLLRQIASPTPPTQAQYQALEQQTLATLIDEELQRQLAEQNRIGITRDDLIQAIQIIEKNNGLRPGQYHEAIKGLEDIANKKIAAEVRWQKLIAKQIQPKVMISTAEVDRLIEDMLNRQKITERELAQIYIAPTQSETPSETEARVNGIYKELTENTNSFEQIARAYSSDAAARRGGIMGWFAPGEMRPELEQAVANLQPGEISAPVKGPQGWHILKLLRQRTTQAVSTRPIEEAALWKVMALKTNNEDIDKKNARLLRKKASRFGSSQDVKDFLSDVVSNPAFAESRDLGWQEISKQPPEAQKTLQRTRKNNSTRIIETPNAFISYFVADRRTRMPEKLEEYRQRIRERLLDNRIDLEARKLMRQLREQAFIDIRL